MIELNNTTQTATNHLSLTTLTRECPRLAHRRTTRAFSLPLTVSYPHAKSNHKDGRDPSPSSSTREEASSLANLAVVKDVTTVRLSSTLQCLPCPVPSLVREAFTREKRRKIRIFPNDAGLHRIRTGHAFSTTKDRAHRTRLSQRSDDHTRSANSFYQTTCPSFCSFAAF